jgi:2',3'-cyclic-nucleotide 2'-phosphodiesterase (5'-nucleotidase family)
MRVADVRCRSLGFRFRQPAIRRGAALAFLLTVLIFVTPSTRVRSQARLRSTLDDRVTLSILGTTDLHGNVFPRGGRGGIAVFAGYVRNLRAVRAADGGAVLLVDSGDTYQGGVESNLSEGRMVVDAYNAIGYTAAAIGNHEFDFGAVDVGGRQQSRDRDPRGALKALAVRAKFPFLAANLLDARTGGAVDWPNVKPSAIVDAAGVKVGLIGVMTIDALRSTLIVNTHGLRVAPLAETIASEGRKLRASGATLIVVVAHAGGRCARFDDPADLSSCESSSEILQVVKRLPPGLVDVIMAGHTHGGLAHKTDGIAITQAFSGGRAFGRVDVVLDRRTRRVADVRVFAPRELCLEEDPSAPGCEPAAGQPAASGPVRYEGRPVVPDAAIDAAMAAELHLVRDLRAAPLGVIVDGPIRRAAEGESPLGNLFADAMRESMPAADAAIGYNLVAGGLRADLPEGPLTFGGLYDVFPFDNRLVQVTLTGAELRQMFFDEIQRDRRGALAIAGIRVTATCSAAGLRVDLRRESGAAIGNDEQMRVVTTDFLAARVIYPAVAASRRFAVPDSAPVLREVVEAWLRRRGGHLREDPFVDPGRRRVESPMLPTHCTGR